MKAGIVSLYDNENHGNRLQSYAIHAILEKRGVSSEAVVFRNSAGPLSEIRLCAQQVRHYCLLDALDKTRLSNFKQFSRFMPVRNIYSHRGCQKATRQLDFLVIGSDQIWNPFFYPLLGANRFASWMPPERVLCLSPSFGISCLPEAYKEQYKEGIERLQYISVREDSGKEIISSLIKRDVPILADPTLGLTSEEWSMVLTEDRCPNEPYILVFMLGNLSEKAQKIIDRQNLPEKTSVVMMSSKEHSQFYCASPRDFLGLIKNAQAVLTDSFHATIFSMLFNTPVAIFEREGSGPEMFSRMATLTSTFGLESRLITQEISSDTLDIFCCDYSEAQVVVEKKREELFRYIDEFLKSLKISRKASE